VRDFITLCLKISVAGKEKQNWPNKALKQNNRRPTGNAAKMGGSQRARLVNRDHGKLTDIQQTKQSDERPKT